MGCMIMILNKDISFKIEEGVLKIFYKENRIYFKPFNYSSVTNCIKNEETDCIFMLKCQEDIIFEIGKITKHKDGEYDIFFIDTYNYKYYKIGRRQCEYIVSFSIIE